MKEQVDLLFRGGMTYKAIARMLGVSRQTLWSWRNEPERPDARKPRKGRLPVQSHVAKPKKPRAIPREVKELAVSRVRSGMTRTEAARLAGVTAGMVSKWCKAREAE